jgi:hypothetical protein
MESETFGFVIVGPAVRARQPPDRVRGADRIFQEMREAGGRPGKKVFTLPDIA